MINLADFQAFYEYKQSFEDFTRDFFDIETTQDVTGPLPELTGHEDLVLAHLCHNILLDTGRTYMVACSTQRQAHYWCQLVCNALMQLPEFMNPGLKKEYHNQIMTGNGNIVRFEVISPNTGRGMTVQAVYIIEPDQVARRVYDEFFCSIYPTMSAGKNRQLIRYSRGY